MYTITIKHLNGNNIIEHFEILADALDIWQDVINEYTGNDVNLSLTNEDDTLIEIVNF